MPSPSTTRSRPSRGAAPSARSARSVRPRILVIADHGDSGASALVAALGRRGRVGVTMVGPDVFSRHRVAHRPSSGSIDPAPLDPGPHADPGPHPDPPVVPDRVPGPRGTTDGPGSPLDVEYAAILCRVATASAGEGLSGGSDADYAAAEMHAVALSWLWDHRDVVVNQPRPEALWGTTPDLLWAAAASRRAGIGVARLLLAADGSSPDPAARCGMEAHPWDGHRVPGMLGEAYPAGRPPLPEPTLWREPLHPGRVRALIAGDEVVGPADWHDPLRRFAAELGLGWVEVVLARSAVDGRGLVDQVLPVPSLAPAGHLAAAVHAVESTAARWTGGGP